ncbi:MAG: tRNA (adenosine(37)-N6)-threonylcarbamoyltransferase complex dimerization subunit type 1 TsaB [Vampirovibrionales bacterium]|nr:tRNA (adenosine(37)-N6)-threonylcarbamoyltransferase complex dimerization subunit type 1 TsaB [Vampirovibrionales bacterium]
MLTLFLDTTAQVMRLALMQHNQWLAQIANPVEAQKTHSSMLIPELQALLRTLCLTPPDINRVVVNVGPGSFTGLRTSVSLAKTIGQFVSDCQLIALNTLAIEAMAWRLSPVSDKKEAANVTVLLNARNQTMYRAIVSFSAQGYVHLEQPAQWLPWQEAGSPENASFGAHHVICLHNLPCNSLPAEFSSFTELQPLCSEHTVWLEAMAACLNHPSLYDLCSWQKLAPLYLQPPRATIKKA